MDIGALGDYVKAHPKAAVAAGVVGGGAVLYGITRKKTEPDKETTATQPVPSSDLTDQTGQPNDYNNYPVINVMTPGITPPKDATEPTRAFHKIIREGRSQKVTAGPPGICPPGYVSAQQPGQPPRCTLVNDAKKKPHQRTSYVPSLGQSPY